VGQWGGDRQDRAISELEAYRLALEEAIGNASTLEDMLGRVAGDDEIKTPSFRFRPWSGELAETVVRELRSFALAHHSGRANASLEPRLLEGRTVVRFRADAVPVVLAVLSPSEARLADVSPDVAMRTSVSHLVPRIRIRPAKWGDAIVASLGRRDVEIDAEDLDSLLHITASSEARPVLTSDRMRKSLRVLVRRDVPSVIVENGLATVRWRFEPDRDALEAALHILRLARAETTSCRLLKIR
jgi:hypothetical protein